MSNTRAEQALSACGGAAITSLFVTPLDVVKVRMQAPAATLQSCEHPTCAGTSSSSVMMRVARHEGVGMLWAGLQPALLMSVPGTVIYFACYEATRDAITACWPRLGESAPLLAGGGARLLTATVVSPVELMRTRMQAEQALLREGMVGGAAALVRREGYGALWKGLSATLWRDVPFSCLYWFGYEGLKRRVRDADGELSPANSFACGALSGAVAAFLTTPFDVLKTRRQVVNRAAEVASGGGVAFDTSRSTPRLVLDIARAEGFGALLAGVVPRVVKVAPSCAIMISTYEMGKSFFLKRRAALAAEERER